MQPSAKVIADSISYEGNRLTTLEVVMHRFILAEMNTHRVFSRNSASSRAIPGHKIIDRVTEDPALPWYWGKEQKGMQSGEELSPADRVKAKDIWLESSSEAVNFALALHRVGVHKSLCNRLLEPFMWHTAIISATEWDNFFWQRCDPAAQPEMKAVADEMQRAYYRSTPKELAHGEWHLPYIDSTDWFNVKADPNLVTPNERFEYLKKVSVARCARVSYLTHDGKRDMDEDVRLFYKLKGSGHWSPFEHVATPIRVDGNYNMASPWSGNFFGWKQFRKEFRHENMKSFVPNLPDLELQAHRIGKGFQPWDEKGDMYAESNL